MTPTPQHTTSGHTGHEDAQRALLRRRRTGLAAAVTVVTLGLLSGGFPVGQPLRAGAVEVAGARTAVPLPRFGLVDDAGGGPWSGGGGWGGGDGNDDGSSGGSTETVDSQPATDAQSRGVVLIDTVLGYEDAAAAGTGIVLTRNGEVLTNYHVVQGATRIRVTIATTGRTYTARVVGHDQRDDIALLKLSGASGLTTATIDDDTPASGDRLSAVGNAGGQDTLTAADGTVTSLNETITTESETGGSGETLSHLIETDADVVPGDSGGPLLDREGEVIGIDTAASSGSEVDGYAIGIERALDVVEQIRSGEETGTVDIGGGAYLGVQVTSTTSSAADRHPGQDTAWEDPTSGALVVGVLAGTPAARAGLAAGDTVTAIGKTAVTSADDVSGAIQCYDAGQSVAITWVDDQGGTHSDTVTLAASPAA